MTPQSLPPEEAAPDEGNPIPAAPPGRPRLLWVRGSDSAKEDQRWTELEEIKRGNDKRWLQHYGWMVLGLTWAFGILFCAALFVWTWHHLVPACWHWLQEPALHKIQTTLFSGGMGAVVTSVLRIQLGKT